MLVERLWSHTFPVSSPLSSGVDVVGSVTASSQAYIGRCVDGMILREVLGIERCGKILNTANPRRGEPEWECSAVLRCVFEVHAPGDVLLCTYAAEQSPVPTFRSDTCVAILNDENPPTFEDGTLVPLVLTTTNVYNGPNNFMAVARLWSAAGARAPVLAKGAVTAAEVADLARLAEEADARIAGATDGCRAVLKKMGCKPAKGLSTAADLVGRLEAGRPWPLTELSGVPGYGFVVSGADEARETTACAIVRPAAAVRQLVLAELQLQGIVRELDERGALKSTKQNPVWAYVKAAKVV